MPSSLLGNSVPIEGGGGLCDLSISCPAPQDTRRQRRRKQNDPKFITIPSNQIKFVLSRCVSLSVGSWSCTSFPPLSMDKEYNCTARPKLQIQILVRVVLWCVQYCATLPSFFLLGTIKNQLQVNASTFSAAAGPWLYRCVGWRPGDDGAWPQRYLRRRASSLNNAGRC